MKKYIKSKHSEILKSARTKSDILGNLSFIEGEDFSFTIKRIYYIYGVKKGVIRGHHAHKKLQQMLICIKGKIRIKLNDGIDAPKSYILDHPSTTLFVDKMIWRTMEWLENDSILLVLASKSYNEKDYIRDFETFKKGIKGVGI